MSDEFLCFCLQSTDVSVQLEALDILGDLLSRFGGNNKVFLLKLRGEKNQSCW